MQFIDLKAQQSRIRNQLEKRINVVLDHGQYVMGPEIAELEDRLVEFSGVRHAVACASGTDALLIALMAMGVGPGDAVLTTPFSFIATAEVIALMGATPVFVDIDPATYNIDPSQLDTAIQAIADQNAGIYPLPKSAQDGPLEAKGVIAVDLFGLPADYSAIRQIARQYDLFFIGDAAQSFGAQVNGTKAVALPDIACTSFFPTKPLGCYGDGGMCFTNDDQMAQALRSIRLHGKGDHKYDNARIGINGRLDTLQAAILLAKFDIFQDEIKSRQTVADRYSHLLSDNRWITIPSVPEGYQSVWAQYSILAQSHRHRSDLQQALMAKDIPTAIYYPVPLHLQRAFTYLSYSKGTFPVSERMTEIIFSLPMHPYLTQEQQIDVATELLTYTGSVGD